MATTVRRKKHRYTKKEDDVIKKHFSKNYETQFLAAESAAKELGPKFTAAMVLGRMRNHLLSNNGTLQDAKNLPKKRRKKALAGINPVVLVLIKDLSKPKKLELIKYLISEM